MNRLIGVAVCTAVVAGCAKDISQIAPAYVSPLAYDSYNCTQIAEEARRISARVAQLTGQQQQAAKNDAAATAVGLILFWPALFFIKGGSATEPQLAQVKGEMDAIEQASIKKKCGITFAPTPIG
jgi:hypothetical protein